MRNFVVEIYWHTGERRAIVSRKIEEIRSIMNKSVSSLITEQTISGLLLQANDPVRFPHVVIFMHGQEEVSLDFFMKNEHVTGIKT